MLPASVLKKTLKKENASLRGGHKKKKEKKMIASTSKQAL
jgi:hypothetical protein